MHHTRAVAADGQSVCRKSTVSRSLIPAGESSPGHGTRERAQSLMFAHFSQCPGNVFSRALAPNRIGDN